VGIGTVERGQEFCDHVKFPVASLLCDPENKAYSAIGLKFGITDTFFNPATPYAIASRLAASSSLMKTKTMTTSVNAGNEEQGSGSSSSSSSSSSSKSNRSKPPTTAPVTRIKNRGVADLAEALGRWKPWIPPKLGQGLQQGGMFVFKGDQEVQNTKN
jgi:hypothetical protein